jgi:hypothetical protein
LCPPARISFPGRGPCCGGGLNRPDAPLDEVVASFALREQLKRFVAHLAKPL